MSSVYMENDGRFPDGSSVEVKFPAFAGQPRELWPWVPATVEGQCEPEHPRGGEWDVTLDDGSWDGPCFRNLDEIRRPTHRNPEWNKSMFRKESDK